MAEKNKVKLTAFEKEQIDVAQKVLEYKLGAEANIVAILYKEPELIYDVNLDLDSFSNNTWKVYWQIAHDIILVEKKNVLDDITIGIYLEKHLKLKNKYLEYGGYDTISAAMGYVKTENLDGYIAELKKWSVVIDLVKLGFPVKDRLSDYADMTEEEIYNEHEACLNHIFANSSSSIKSYNVFDDMHEFIKELNDSSEVGMPFYNAPLLTGEVGGFNLNGNIYGLGAGSGVGKSTMAFNYIIPSAIENNQKVVMIINEEDERKMRKELLVWVANNIINKDSDTKLHKRVIRDGNFDEETIDLLKRCADWIEEKKDQQILTVIPLERYSVNIAIKVIKKYASLGCRIFILDTLKESFDAKTDEIYKSMMRDMVALYDVVKPSAKNVGLFVTYQLGKGSLKMRHLTNNEIGQAKSIVDVMSVNLMMRRPYEDEYESLSCYSWKGKGKKKEKIPFSLNKENNPMLTFITKNRFGVTDAYQIVSECDLSTNVYKDVGYCVVPQDF